MKTNESGRRSRRTVRGVLTVIVAICLTVIGTSARAEGPTPATSPFSDVPTTHPYYKEIAWMYTSGISTGWDDGTYRPAQTVDRNAIAAFFYRYQGSPTYLAPSQSPFTDITSSSDFYKEMSWMKSMGISTGWADGTFRPWTETARHAMAAFMYRVASSPAYTSPAASLFADIELTDQFYKEISWVYQVGVANNADDGTFDPDVPVTREMMAVFMYRLVNPPALTIQITALPGASVGAAYQAALRASGGGTAAQPFTWSATGLPAGLSMSTGGVISGIPTAAGTSSVKLTVTDKIGNQKTATLSLRVAATTNDQLVVTKTSVSVAVVGSAFSEAMTAAGGLPPYSWTASGVPAGLTMSSTGVLAGTPTSAGSDVMTVQVTDAEGVRSSSRITYTVNPILSIITSTLNLGVTNSAYSSPVAAQGGVAPYKWSAVGLPTGLTINQSTGTIGGTPKTAAKSTVTVTVTDNRGSKISKQLSLEISQASNCAVLKCIALTFDDGPLGYSDSLTNALSAAGARATFFDVGTNVRDNPDAVKRKFNAGMEVGVHGWDHVAYSEYDYNYVRYDLDAAASAIEGATGKWPNVWRPPYGYYNPTTVDAAGNVGLATIMWTQNTFDYEYTNSNSLLWDTVDYASRNAVVLMHDGYSSARGGYQRTAATAAALPGIVAELQAQGYTLVTVSVLLGKAPESGKVYFDDNGVYHY